MGAYDAHDKLTSGTSGSESDGYDAMGNETSISINGGTYHLVYDDEDRLTSITTPSGTDTFTYNGLSLRVGKTDSTGTYSYVCDGTSPGSPVLSDGVALYTPGLSENRGGASRYYSNDQRGNLWTIDASSKGQLDYQDTTGFGTLVAQAGSSSVFGYGGGNGCQTDADTGLILMGHRYYDTRIGRFISQDPIGVGSNWYSYAGNNPTNKKDPLGLTPMDGLGSSPTGSPGYGGVADGAGYAENFIDEENSRDDYNQQVDSLKTYFEMSDAEILGSLGILAPQADNLTGSISYGGSISLGLFRFSGAVGGGYDFKTGKYEFFYQYGTYAGWGLGASCGLGATLGNDALGNFGGFNGPSFNLDYLAGSHGLLGIEMNQNYFGGEYSPTNYGPFSFTQYGAENGVYGGFTNTVPIGPSGTLFGPGGFKVPTLPTLHF